MTGSQGPRPGQWEEEGAPCNCGSDGTDPIVLSSVLGLKGGSKWTRGVRLEEGSEALGRTLGKNTLFFLSSFQFQFTSCQSRKISPGAPFAPWAHLCSDLLNVSLLSPTQGPYSGQNQLRRQCLLFLKAAAKPETPFSLRTGGVDMQSGLWTTLNSGVCLYL